MNICPAAGAGIGGPIGKPMKGRNLMALGAFVPHSEPDFHHVLKAGFLCFEPLKEFSKRERLNIAGT
jgi:hypothetical protein